MPGILDVVTQALDGNAVQTIARQLGIDPQQAQGAIGAALPTLLAGLSNNAQGGGAQALHALLAQHDGSILNDVAGFLGSGGGAGAAGLLQQVLGPHQALAQSAVAAAGGLAPQQAQQLLGSLAPVVMGAVGQATQQQGLDPSSLAQMLQGEHEQVAGQLAQSHPALASFASQLLGQGAAGGALGEVAKGLGGLFGGGRS